MNKKPILIHEVHDMWPATLIELGGMSRYNPFVQILQMAENSAYRHSDAVASILPNAESYMIQHGLAKGKFVYIPNGIVMDDWKEPPQLPEKIEKELEKTKEKGKFIVGYFGGHALSNALDILLDTAKEIKGRSEKIEIVMVGDGVEKNRLLNRVRDEKISNVLMLDAVPKRCIPNLIARFDCVYIGTLDSSLYRFGMGYNKFYDSMMAGKPVILSTNAKNTDIERTKCGIIVPAGDIKGISDAIMYTYRLSGKERLSIGNRGKREVLEKYTYDKLAQTFESVMDSIANAKEKSRKRILYIDHYAGSIDMGMEYRPYYFAREWIKEGHHVDIVAADFSHLRKKNPVIYKDFEEEIIDGIHYHWIHTGTYSENGIKRAMSMFTFVGKLIIHAKKIARLLNPDVIITSSTYPLDTYAGQLIRQCLVEK